MQPFRLPGAVLFKVPVDYRPNERAVQWRKTMVAWKVSNPAKPGACLEANITALLLQRMYYICCSRCTYTKWLSG